MKKITTFFICILLLPAAGFCADMAFMVLDHNSYLADQAVQHLGLKTDIQVITADDVIQRPDDMKTALSETDLVVVDVMGRELASFLTDNIDLTGKTLYALRGSLDNESLQKKGFNFDPVVGEYYHFLSRENVENMLRLVIHRHLDDSVDYAPVVTRPETGIYHPDAGRIFTRTDAYLDWRAEQPRYDPDHPVIAFLFFSSFLTKGQRAPVDHIIRRLEARGFTVLPCYGREKAVIRSYLLDERDTSRADLVLAFSFKFYNSMTDELNALMKKLDVPVFNAVSFYRDTIEEWRKSPVGIDPLAVAWSLAAPEISGVIEPTALAAKEKITDPNTGNTYFLARPIEENLERLIPRLKNWVRLQDLSNPEKRIALMFYNHHQGKQNIGASYLNVFQSMEAILAALAKNGFQTGRSQEKKPLTEEEIKTLILASARNVGSWAPGELDKLVSAGRVVRLPKDTYKRWFEDLPDAFKEQVIEQWGEPEAAGIMTSGTDFIIPAVQAGNIILLPEPARGWGDEPMKLMHDVTLFPHHQYLAVYLWLQHGFKADAMIHLGTHSTYEWTPGKQADLSPACPPEVLITDIPNLYPYIVDNLGEGIQAKRRGRGVMISHLTPTLRKSDIHGEYSRMAELIDGIERAESRGSVTVLEKTEELLELAGETGILEDLKFESFARDHGVFHTKKESSHYHPGAAASAAGDGSAEPAREIDIADIEQDETIHLLGHFLEEIKESMIPYGMHTFGVSPAQDEIDDMAAAVTEWNPETDADQVKKDLARSGPNEMNSLIRGLGGRLVHPGQGNDPLRNPEALPTGRNFFGFNPGKMPTPAAWELGRKAARDIIANHIVKHGSYPAKVAVILWATETLRNEGVNESTILYLIGTRPKWSKTGRVLGVELIPSGELNRPRIDVMINASGLYRDLYPDKLRYIDRAIDLAARQTDLENFIARNNADIKTRLIRQGMAPEEAEEMSRFRIFSEPPGAYGNGVGDMASGSSKWDDPHQVVGVYENRMGYAFGEDQWGKPAKKLFRENLAGVDVAVHSRSSNVYGLMDNDDMFQYLGGLSMAIRKESGKAPETLITQQQKKGRVHVEDVGKTLGREMRTRYLNPKWIEGMKAEDYAGARAMSDFAEYLWGWNMTAPEKVDGAKWNQTYEVYVKDKYGLELKEFFDKASPWAYQSMTGRMLETHRKGYWQADRTVLDTLASEYARSVIRKGLACCDHTCNNPLLNQMVVSIISVPGVLSPELVEQFKLAVEQMARADLDRQVADRQQLIRQLAAPAPDPAEANPDAAPDTSRDNAEMVEGYKMEKVDTPDQEAQMRSSGIEWMAVAAVLAIMALAFFGARKRNH